ncbi:MAG: putative sulfate exporter family transporter [Chloroflexi bacterium]|nr:putative sulfate exporter family transporter [Chloroflexota bacterium]
MKNFARENGLGILIALTIALAAYFAGRIIPVVGGAVVGISLGILTTSLWKLPLASQKGVKFTSKYILQLAVVLLGFDMNTASVIRVGQQSVLVIGTTLMAAFLTAAFVGRLLKVNKKLTILIGVGTAICGGSAIAAASSAINAEDQDISYSISTIFLFNVLAVFLFPLIGHLLKLSDTGFGMWAGTAINDTSSVVAAGYSFSNAAGNFATVVKLTRSLMIVPVTLALALLTAREHPEQQNFRLVKIFPWFVLGFLAAAILNSSGWMPVYITANLALTGKFLIIMAMVAIGLNTSLQAFIKAGPRAVLLGAATWSAVALSSLAVQLIARIW